MSDVRGVAHLAVITALMAGLGGCAAAPPQPPSSTARSIPSTTPTALPHAAVPAAAGVSIPVFPHHGPSLVGLSTKDVTLRLGEPHWTRRDAPAAVWQYLGPGCVLDLYVYADAGVERVLYVEARDSASRAVEAQVCVDRIEAQHQSPPAS